MQHDVLIAARMLGRPEPQCHRHCSFCFRAASMPEPVQPADARTACPATNRRHGRPWPVITLGIY